MITYRKLWVLLKKRELMKKDLLAMCAFSSTTIAKLAKNEPVMSTVIARICEVLEVQPGDIMEYIEKK